MHYMHDLKDLLCAELEDFAEKGKKSGKMSMSDVETVHKLTDTVKNILKIDMMEEDGGYSEDSRWMGEGRMYGNSYDDDMRQEHGSSYARGRRRYAKRDSMGRYSRDDGKHYMIEQIEEMMESAKKPTEREALKRCMQALERA